VRIQMWKFQRHVLRRQRQPPAGLSDRKNTSFRLDLTSLPSLLQKDKASIFIDPHIR
jgi:hypothetical protein